MNLPPKSFVEQPCVVCKRQRREVELFQCMSNYVDANALANRARPCFNCPQGATVRQNFGRS